MSKSEEYNVNFFRPLSDHAKANKRLILILASIWAIGVFGFQILLMILNEPTLEQAFLNFEKVYPVVVDDTSATDEMKTTFAKSLLMVLGKNIAVTDEHKAILRQSFSWAIASMHPDFMMGEFQEEPDAKSYNLAITALNLKNDGFDKIMRDLVPYAMVRLEETAFPQSCRTELGGIMNLYLVHNQNALTEIRFLGFPFHYWYTAQFLLILFVILCVIYASAIQKANEKYDFVEET